jgi:hypothetical protein
MAERPASRALLDDGTRLGYVVAVIVAAGSAYVCGYVWAYELESTARNLVGLSAAAAGVLLIFGIAWATRYYLGGPATRHDGMAGHSLRWTLRDRSSNKALDSARGRRERPVTGAEWMQMATEFRNVRDVAVRAEWHKDPIRESWSLAGPMPVALEHTKALCTRAGAMLLGSPRLAVALSERVRAHEDPVDRWLEFIREQPQTRMQVLDMSHTIAIPVEGGYIQDVPTVSARACIACSADEI